ncbi:hypothetical protein [Stenotrophomonas cyclobalanopsidis]|uniref:hypothetical protein n=1 Tax=Stenotrophomonas cyclobalanopsidis TaxID=2771362 RepID=UPI00345FDC13
MKAAHNAYPSSADEREIRHAYGHMRGMVERAVREIVLNDTVHPFSHEELRRATEFEADIATLEAVIRPSEDRRRAFNRKEKQFKVDLRNKVRQG